MVAHYEFHDGWGASRQIVEDPRANAKITIEFVKQVLADDNDKIESSAWKVLIAIDPIDAK